MIKWVKSLIRSFYLREEISRQQAQDIALKRVPGEILKFNMDYDDGILTYKFLIITPENKIYKVTSLAKDGRILKVKEKDELD